VFDETDMIDPTLIKNSEDDLEELSIMVGIETTLQRVLESGSDSAFSAANSSYLGLVTSLACPEDSDYIYLGGIFKTVTDAAQGEQVSIVPGELIVTSERIQRGGAPLARRPASPDPTLPSI
jgi:hypothetical protein